MCVFRIRSYRATDVKRRVFASLGIVSETLLGVSKIQRRFSLRYRKHICKRVDHSPPSVCDFVCRTLKSTLRGVLKSEFFGSQKRGRKGEAKRGEVVGD